MNQQWKLWMNGIAGVATVGAALSLVEGCSRPEDQDAADEGPIGTAQGAITSATYTVVPGATSGGMAVLQGRSTRLINPDGTPCGGSQFSYTANNLVTTTTGVTYVRLGTAASSATCPQGSIAALNQSDIVILVGSSGYDRPASGMKVGTQLIATDTPVVVGSTTAFPTPGQQSGQPSLALRQASFRFEQVSFQFNERGVGTANGKTFAGIADPAGRGRDIVDDKYYNTSATFWTIRDTQNVAAQAAFMPDWGFIQGSTNIYLKPNSAVAWRLAPPRSALVRICTNATAAALCAASTAPQGASLVGGVFNL